MILSNAQKNIILNTCKQISNFFAISYFVFCSNTPLQAYEKACDSVQKTECADGAIGKDTLFYHTKSQSFEKFVQWSNEKAKIAEEILKVIHDPKDSLLDIGAGDGALTKLLETKFAHITAIEPAFQMFNSLKETCNSNKYTLINTIFEKQNLTDKFDIILASHSFRYIQNPSYEIHRINNLLKDSGVFLLIDLPKESDFWNFYHKYEALVLGTTSKDPEMPDYDGLLGKVFNVTKVNFTPTLVIPSIDDAISILDFLFNIDFNEIKKEALVKIKSDLLNTYGNGPVTINFQQIMYVCSKKVINK